MPTGRHARDTAAPVEPSLTTEVPSAAVPAPRVTVEVQVATPTGRRRRAVLLADDVPAEAAPATRGGWSRCVEPQPDAPETAAAVPAAAVSGSGRRRKPTADTSTPVPAPTVAVPAPTVAVPAPTVAAPAPGAAAQAPSGRRRKAPAVEAPVQVTATGNGQRRRVVAEPEVVTEPKVVTDPAAVLAIHAAAAKRAVAAKHGVAPKPAVTQPERVPAPKVVAVPAIPDVGAPVPVADVVPIETAAGHRHRARRSLPIPGNPALVAGAAAVAIAAVGVVASTTGGSNVAAADADLARASVPGLDQPVVHVPAAPDPTAAARASRDHARQLLALRLKNEAKQDALEKALKLAAQRATRLAALAKEFFLPVKGYHLTAGFGEGGGLWAHGHTGQDFACPTGTPIHALASGTIVYTGWYGAYGWLTVERLADNTEIWYAHQSKILVHSGPVVAGQEIGHVGSTGNTTGPHLHLEVHPQGGPPVDPMPWLRAHGMHP